MSAEDFVDLVTASAVTATGPGRYRWDVPAHWGQGRGVFGGLVMAAVMRALEGAYDVAEQPLRSVTATLCGPVVVGEAELHLSLLRKGSNTTAVEARVVQGDEVRTHLVALLGRRRVEDGDWDTHPKPDMGDGWAALPVAPLGPPMAPEFTQQIAFRPTGPLPFSGSEDKVGLGWVHLRRPGELRDTALLAALIDAWWPAFLVRETAFRPIGTVSFTMNFLGNWEGLDPDAPLFYSARSTCAVGGYVVEFRELWGHDGRLMALNQQTIAIIR